MDRKTAADIIHSPDTTIVKEPRAYRTHPDKLAAFWPEVEDLLKNDGKLKAYALFEEMRRRHPDAFEIEWKRTFERRVRDWKIDQRIEKEVTFDQVHKPGDVLAVDFTVMNELSITLNHQRFDHLVFHSVLTYSNWEYVQLCASESFEALAQGIQGSFVAMGGVTLRIRTDSLSAAVNNLSTDRHFRTNYQNLLDHFQVEPHRINVRSPNENGDCESLHGHFKDYVDQRLRIRGSRDFDTKQEWIAFLQDCIKRRNNERDGLFQTEQEALADLPRRLFPVYTETDCTVSSNSIITVKQNRYSVPSCFIGSRVAIRIYADDVQLWYAGKHHLTMPRLIGKNLEFVDFRHVIDTLVRKPGAFENYRYREHMFPTLDLRKAFDNLTSSLGQGDGVRVYLRLLQVAKSEGMASIEPWITKLLIGTEKISKKSLMESLNRTHAAVPVSAVDDVKIEEPDLNSYDDLLEHKEVLDGHETEPQPERDERCAETIGTGLPFEATSSSDDACDGDEPGRSSGQGELDSLQIPERVDTTGMRDTSIQSNWTGVEEVWIGAQQDVGPNRLETSSVDGPPADGPTSARRVPEGRNQSSDIWETRFGEDFASGCTWGLARAIRSYGLQSDVCETGTTLVVGEEGIAIATNVIEAREVFGVDHRRSGLRSAESRGDGSTFYIDSRSLREDEYSAEQQPTVFQVGEHLQGPDDDRSGNRSLGTPQRDPRAERAELPLGASEQRKSRIARRDGLNQESFEREILTVAKVRF